ncbi:hypothetical protein [Phocoenobacter skyensis]|uniref:Uncharacterized protein n=1 Tax=Phocoenobacter skyensis TaxID=97481 RepID=A0A1H7ZPB7_9PAST|nr:hypothetical protein [Pasteurella skyensis]MDP8079899.1 hypothetical protein [Pasteurella skyensis]MDP8085779.1 hypothetical protein [Pasteurella skyensis]MDP8185998.1 hypothetical protein [Pasteurella skyensis]QLB21865.1 hypothetical protein A6B44_01020 [Pasteurella skyensis]SEM60240.1 hypothetical protein SAMN05444853_1286 [Pasteurella skyensis]
MVKHYNISTQSQANIKDSIWLICNDGINTIQIGLSMLGKERIFVNNKLVVEKRNLKLTSTSEFTDDKGNAYKVTFKVLSLVKGIYECVVQRNNEVVRVFSIKYQHTKSKRLSVIRILILLLIGFSCGLLQAIYGFSHIISVIVIVLSIILLNKNKCTKSKYIIEEL